MNKELINQAANALVLSQIALRDSSLKIADDFDPVLEDRELKYQLRNSLVSVEQAETPLHEDRPDVVTYRFTIEAGMRMIRPYDVSDLPSETVELDEPDVALEIVARFAVYFDSKSGDLCTECLHEFGRHNCIFQIWPYWREFIASQLGRAHVPVFTIPMYRLPR